MGEVLFIDVSLSLRDVLQQEVQLVRNALVVNGRVFPNRETILFGEGLVYLSADIVAKAASTLLVSLFDIDADGNKVVAMVDPGLDFAQLIDDFADVLST